MPKKTESLLEFIMRIGRIAKEREKNEIVKVGFDNSWECHRTSYKEPSRKKK